ncbi:MAG TPA: acylneuraminate cytidylyltransferase family protein [Coxiellaceae bacterium]|nr:acylneuraminate cytidylyltransferase family protein [Coxiellaceae bacterium]
MTKRYLAVIPARGGSKGIPKKNIVLVNQKPLIQYTIESALPLLKRNQLSELILSTDSKEIARVGYQLGLSVPFLRPPALADDHANMADCLLHALDFFEQRNSFFDAIVLLQPTSPLRRSLDIEEALRLYEQGNTDSLISIYKEECINDRIMYDYEAGWAIPFNSDHNKGLRRQESRSIYIRNGAIYIVSTDYLKRTHTLFSDRPLAYVMPKHASLNIDTPDDLTLLAGMLCCES